MAKKWVLDMKRKSLSEIAKKNRSETMRKEAKKFCYLFRKNKRK
jgi:hypothetical protein